jgi:hypothetical protein
VITSFSLTKHFQKEKKQKKKKAIPSSGGLQKSKGGEARTVYIPLLFCQPGTFLCFSFYCVFWSIHALSGGHTTIKK